MPQKPYEGYILVNSHTYKFNPPILGLFPHSLLQNSKPKPFQKFSESSNIPRIYEERTSKNCHPKYLIYCIFPKILPNVQRRSYIFLHPWDLRILVIIIKSVFFFSKKTYFFCQISVRNKRNISHRMGVKLQLKWGAMLTMVVSTVFSYMQAKLGLEELMLSFVSL